MSYDNFGGVPPGGWEKGREDLRG